MFDNYKSGLGACHIALQAYHNFDTACDVVGVFYGLQEESHTIWGCEIAGLLVGCELPADYGHADAQAVVDMAWMALERRWFFAFEVGGDKPPADRRWAVVLRGEGGRLHWAECVAPGERPEPYTDPRERMTGEYVWVRRPLPEHCAITAQVEAEVEDGHYLN